MLASLKRTGRIGAREWLDFLRAVFALLNALVAVRFRPNGRLLSYDLNESAQGHSPEQLQRIGQLELALDRAVRHTRLKPKCLARSVALHRLLQRAGIRGSRIRIGVRPDSTGLSAHAWVTLSDRVLGDDPRFVGRFTEIADASVAGLA